MHVTVSDTTEQAKVEPVGSELPESAGLPVEVMYGCGSGSEIVTVWYTQPLTVGRSRKLSVPPGCAAGDEAVLVIPRTGAGGVTVTAT